MIPCTHATAQRIANAEAPAVSLYGPGELRRVTCTHDTRGTRWILETTDGTRLRLSVKHTTRKPHAADHELRAVIQTSTGRIEVRPA